MRTLAGPVARVVVAAWAAALVAVLAATPARADVYTWVDEEGTVHFSEEPPQGEGKRARKVELPRSAPRREEAKRSKEERASRDAPPAAAPAVEDSAAPPPPAAARQPPSVTIYSTSWCPWCERTRAYFRRRGIAFVDLDIERDGAARERKLALTGNEAVPTVVIGAAVVQGFRPAEFEKALER